MNYIYNIYYVSKLSTSQSPFSSMFFTSDGPEGLTKHDSLSLFLENYFVVASLGKFVDSAWPFSCGQGVHLLIIGALEMNEMCSKNLKKHMLTLGFSLFFVNKFWGKRFVDFILLSMAFLFEVGTLQQKFIYSWEPKVPPPRNKALIRPY